MGASSSTTTSCTSSQSTNNRQYVDGLEPPEVIRVDDEKHVVIGNGQRPEVHSKDRRNCTGCTGFDASSICMDPPAPARPNSRADEQHLGRSTKFSPEGEGQRESVNILPHAAASSLPSFMQKQSIEKEVYGSAQASNGTFQMEELTAKQQSDFQLKIKDARRGHLARVKEHCKKEVSKLQSGCWMSRDGEKHIEGWQNATLTAGVADTSAELSPRTAKINACKVRMMEKLRIITDVSKGSPLSQIPADEAVRFFAARLDIDEMTEGTFLEATRELITKFGKNVNDDHIVQVFKALDIDETGGLDKIEWISSVPLFYGGSLEVAKAVFEEIDQDKSGALDLEEFADYASSTITMLIAPDEKELRKELAKILAQTIFAEIDEDGGGTISAEEFTQWSQIHSLGSSAIQCLEDHIRSAKTAK